VRSSASISARERFALLGDCDPSDAMFADFTLIGLVVGDCEDPLHEVKSSLGCITVSRARQYDKFSNTIECENSK
jgi:hypothetical protein